MKLVNVCSLATFNCQKIDLDKVFSDSYKHARRGVFSNLIIKQPQGTVFLFKSGKVMCVGAKSVAGAEETIKDVAQKLGYQILNFRITNMVGSSALGFPLRLADFFEGHLEQSEWIPEEFPGLRFRFKKLGVTLIVFASGKMYVTGAKEWQQIEEAFEIFRRLAIKYKSSRSI